jgi:hypothetical protein
MSLSWPTRILKICLRINVAPSEIIGFNSIARRNSLYLRNWSKLVESHWGRWALPRGISRSRIAVEAPKLVISR